jgi:FkbH-like protein
MSELQSHMKLFSNFEATAIVAHLIDWTAYLEYKLVLSVAPWGDVVAEVLASAGMSNERNQKNEIIVFLIDVNSWCDPSASQEHNVVRSCGPAFTFLNYVDHHVNTRGDSLLVLLCPDSSKTITIDSETPSQMEISFLAELERAIPGCVQEWRSLTKKYSIGSPLKARPGARNYRSLSGRVQSALAIEILRHSCKLRWSTLPPYKVIVVDGDGTLWNEPASEVSGGQVTIENRHLRLISSLTAKKSEGAILAFCSTNDPEDIAAVERVHPCISDFLKACAAKRINWDEKADNIVSMSEQLGLGIDTFILLDDDQVVIELTNRNLPHLLCLHAPVDLEGASELLGTAWSFDSGPVTEEDRLRSEYYQGALPREQLLKAVGGDLSEYLSRIDFSVDVRPASATEIERVAQLTRRCTRFNTTGIYWTPAQLRSKENIAWVAQARDCFSDYGIISAVIGQTTDRTFSILSFTLSCRAFARFVEDTVFAKLFQLTGCETMAVHHARTERNKASQDFILALSKLDDVRWEADVLLVPASAMNSPLVRTSSARSVISTHEQTQNWNTLQFSNGSDKLIRPAAEERASFTRKLLARLMLPSDNAGAHTPVRSRNAVMLPTPAVIAACMAQSLGLGMVQVNQDFFDLGGDSLQAMELLIRLSGDFGFEVPLTLLFQSEFTALSLAKEVEETVAQLQACNFVTGK